MCSVNRISAEPPGHSRATFAAKHCPFLAHPLAKRPSTDDLKEKFGEPTQAGVALLHNPGVTFVWQCFRYSLNRETNGILFEIGPPHRCAWYREGRDATRQEVLDSFDLGLPTLRGMAESDGPAAVRELDARLQRAMQLIPEMIPHRSEPDERHGHLYPLLRAASPLRFAGKMGQAHAEGKAQFHPGSELP